MSQHNPLPIKQRSHGTGRVSLDLFALICLLSLGLASAAHADVASDLHDQLKERWYTTELIVFRYLDAAPEEQLLHEGTRRANDSEAAAAEEPENDGDARLAELTARVLGDDEQDEQEEAERPALDVAPLSDIADSMSGADLRALVTQNLATWEQQLRESEGQWLSGADLELTEQAEKLAAHRRTEVLLHTGWVQAVPERNAGKPVTIAAGDAFADPRTGAPRSRLEGEIEVTLGRYLHLQPTLYYTPGSLDLQPDATAPFEPTAAPPDEPRRPTVRDLSQPSALDRLRDREIAARAQPELAASPRPATDFAAELPPYIRLHQSRRLRSGELHYIDHPELGIVARIKPVSAPPQLLEQFALLQ